MRRSAHGVGSLANSMPISSAASVLSQVTDGIWTRSCSPCVMSSTICSGRKFFRRLLKKLTEVPRVIVTDKRRSYGAANREMLPSVEHRQHRYLNNRAENSHQPTRQWERRMRGFKSPGHAQRFLSAYGPITQHFRLRRHLLSGQAYRQEMVQRFQSWQEVTGLAVT
jgi:putative transposase